MRKGKQIKAIEEIVTLVAERRSVVLSHCATTERYPAAFVLNMSVGVVMRAIQSGRLWEYPKPTRRAWDK